MLEQAVRQAILELHRRGQGVRAIARALRISRAAVRDVLRRGSAEVPRLARPEKALDHREDILQLLQQCEGSFMRVHEELAKGGLQLSYPAFTAFCRRHGIGHEPKTPAGRYDFAPGQEMQHDTSPHDLHLGGKLRRVQTASLVLAYSRMLFFQFYPRFRRFECKVFLTEALRYMDGACQTCMIDNTHVVVLTGTGSAMIPVPEMAAFAERFGFTFVAHAVGDANRSGRVERMFRFIERGFLPGRRFTDWADANRQARAWCDREVEPRSRYVFRPEHRPPRGQGWRHEREPFPEEKDLRHLLPEIDGYLAALKRRGKLQTTLALRQLLRMAREYPHAPLLAAVQTAAHYGLYDLGRLERMVLRGIATTYFQLPLYPEPAPGEPDDEPTDGRAPAAPQELAPEPDGREPA